MTGFDRLAAALADRYRLERPLGEGGMATVYLAHDVRHDRTVAVKVLRPELAAVIGGDRFITEIRTTANLQHPHILPLFDSGEVDGFLYYVMPYVSGESLRQRLDRERQLPVDEAIRIARDVAAALDYAHRQGVLHRDIKPENILLHDGRPIVADFGIALALSAAGGGRMTETGLSLGTPHYMSPEQASADRDLSPRSDLYSLACVLYEMLAGDPPHTGPNAQVVLMRIITEPPRPVTDARSTVPAHVAAALAKALEKLPADRFDGVASFERALSDASFSYERGTGMHTAVVRGAQTGTRPWLRDPRSIAALVALAALVSFAAWMLSLRSTAPTLFPVRMNLDVGDLSAADPSVRLDISPDGRTIAMTATIDGLRALWVRGAAEPEFRFVPQTEGAGRLAFSPDGEWIVFEYDGGLRRVPVTGGAPFKVMDGGALIMPHWGQDGSILYASPAFLFRIHESGAVDTVLQRFVAWPRLLPDGSGILFTDDPASVYLLDLATDSIILLIPQGVDARYIETGHLLFGHPEGGLFAVPFDLGRHEVTGQPVRVLDEVSISGGERVTYAVSRTGTLVYGAGRFSGLSGDPQLLVVHMTGEVDTLPLAPREFNDLRWSPDGRSVVYSSGDEDQSQIFVYDVEHGSNPRQITFGGSNDSPVWSPDGTRIAFRIVEDSIGNGDLFVKSLDESTAVRLLTRPADRGPDDWPEQDLLVFREYDSASETDGNWTVAPDSGSEPKPYLQPESGGFLSMLAVAPGGGLAAYGSYETGQSEIHVRSFPEARGRTAVSEAEAWSARWSPDGNTIYYWKVSAGGPTDTLYAARVQRDPMFRVLSREAIHAGPRVSGYSWDVHPDGDRYIIPRRPGSMPTPEQESAREKFFVVVNWFEEMKAKLGQGR